jgi:repressor LexA
MASKDFSNKLKSLRLKAGYSQKDVYEHFKIPQSTFSSWEVGKSEPSGEMLIKLCEFYKCDMVKEFSSDNDLTYIEWEMIEKYRSLDPYGQETISYILDREAERIKTHGKISDHRVLNLIELSPAADKTKTLPYLHERNHS